MLDSENLDQIVACASVDLVHGDVPIHDRANTIKECSRVALGLAPRVDIAELPFDVQNDLLAVMRGVRQTVADSQPSQGV